MHLKRFRSETVREALALARHELGPDALVLSTRLVAVRGVRGWMGGREVELTAALDAGVSESRPPSRSADTSDDLAETFARFAQGRPGLTPEAVAKVAVNALANAQAAAGGSRKRTPEDVSAAPSATSTGSPLAGGSFPGGAFASSASRPQTGLSAFPQSGMARAVAARQAAQSAGGRRARGGRVGAPSALSRYETDRDDDFEDLLSPDGVEEQDATLDAVIGRLCATGMHRALAERIAKGLPKQQRRNGSLDALERAVAAELTPFAAGNEPYAAVEVFVGPPGAGKTTTIAKIAAQERARRGTKLNLLAADGFRVGAVEQLRLYADIIGSPFAVARTPAEIERTILTTRGTVLVDTAGRSVRDPRAHEVVALLHGLPGVRTHLVMPAAAQVRDVRRMFDAYEDKAPNRVVLTRIDEADSVSPLLQVFQERGVKISYLGTGQRVPEDLERATPQRLAVHVLGHGIPDVPGDGARQGAHA